MLFPFPHLDAVRCPGDSLRRTQNTERLMNWLCFFKFLSLILTLNSERRTLNDKIGFVFSNKLSRFAGILRYFLPDMTKKPDFLAFCGLIAIRNTPMVDSATVRFTI